MQKADPVNPKVEKLTDGQWNIKYAYTRTMVNDTLAYEYTHTLNGTALFKEDGNLISTPPILGPRSQNGS